jgi:prevent-host-death family protein
MSFMAVSSEIAPMFPPNVPERNRVESEWSIPQRPMKLSQQVRSISHLKANAPELIRRLAERREPVVLTVNGEAKAVLQDIESYDQTQETLVLFKILALAGRFADGPTRGHA